MCSATAALRAAAVMYTRSSSSSRMLGVFGGIGDTPSL
jgi:hypothetical protein